MRVVVTTAVSVVITSVATIPSVVIAGVDVEVLEVLSLTGVVSGGLLK